MRNTVTLGFELPKIDTNKVIKDRIYEDEEMSSSSSGSEDV